MRTRASLLLLILLCLTLVAGCGGKDARGKFTAEMTAGKAVSKDTMEATVGAAKESGDVAEADAASKTISDGEETGSSGGSPFVADPEMSGGEGSEADSMLTVRYGKHDRYERVVLDLGAGLKPARDVPQWNLTSPTGDGMLRIYIPSVNVTKVSDGKLDDGTLKDFHVVRGPEDGMFVDVFASKAFTYRVLELKSPARLAVDFKTSKAPLGMPLPSEGGKTVLAQPRVGERVEGSLTVSGYSRNFEGANTITLADAGGEVIARKTVQSNDWSDTWGYFETTMKVPAFSGKGTLRVGAASARDGEFEGVEVPVRGT